MFGREISQRSVNQPLQGEGADREQLPVISMSSLIKQEEDPAESAEHKHPILNLKLTLLQSSPHFSALKSLSLFFPWLRQKPSHKARNCETLERYKSRQQLLFSLLFLPQQNP
ncbi:hypothetical protein AMECASPLE_021093 [Ameca splendens]|uniref:Uncharacterized protein n=1 Tax=Ameca splendens TaxID=208324 RepID=A0ABV0ZCA1_9TELE